MCHHRGYEHHPDLIDVTNITRNIQQLQARISEYTQQAGREVGSVRLLAVSKTKAPAAIREAFAAGQKCFGENYVQEAIGKMNQLADLPLEWHYIGSVQSNKTRLIAKHFDWLHSLDSLKHAQRLQEQRPSELGPLQACIQVNISNESSKNGLSADEVSVLATAIETLPNLNLRGLMVLPAIETDPKCQHATFRETRHLLEALNKSGHRLDTLSMGMSHDLQAAIEEGATLVRVGTAIFGSRN